MLAAAHRDDEVGDGDALRSHGRAAIKNGRNAELPKLVAAPGVDVAFLGDGQGMRVAGGDGGESKARFDLDGARTVVGEIVAKAESAVIATSPGEDLTISCKA